MFKEQKLVLFMGGGPEDFSFDNLGVLDGLGAAVEANDQQDKNPEGKGELSRLDKEIDANWGKIDKRFASIAKVKADIEGAMTKYTAAMAQDANGEIAGFGLPEEFVEEFMTIFGEFNTGAAGGLHVIRFENQGDGNTTLAQPQDVDVARMTKEGKFDGLEAKAEVIEGKLGALLKRINDATTAKNEEWRQFVRGRELAKYSDENLQKDLDNLA